MAKEKLKELTINPEWCKGCGICLSFCPKQVIELGPDDRARVARLEECICCHLCEIRCPDLAIELFTSEDKLEEVYVQPAYINTVTWPDRTAVRL